MEVCIKIGLLRWVCKWMLNEEMGILQERDFWGFSLRFWCCDLLLKRV